MSVWPAKVECRFRMTPGWILFAYLRQSSAHVDTHPARVVAYAKLLLLLFVSRHSAVETGKRSCESASHRSGPPVCQSPVTYSSCRLPDEWWRLITFFFKSLGGELLHIRIWSDLTIESHSTSTSARDKQTSKLRAGIPQRCEISDSMGEGSDLDLYINTFVNMLEQRQSIIAKHSAVARRSTPNNVTT